MDVLATKATKNAAELVLGVVFNGSDAGYPFQIAVNVTCQKTRESPCHAHRQFCKYAWSLLADWRQTGGT